MFSKFLSQDDRRKTTRSSVFSNQRAFRLRLSSPTVDVCTTKYASRVCRADPRPLSDAAPESVHTTVTRSRVSARQSAFYNVNLTGFRVVCSLARSRIGYTALPTACTDMVFETPRCGGGPALELRLGPGLSCIVPAFEAITFIPVYITPDCRAVYDVARCEGVSLSVNMLLICSSSVATGICLLLAILVMTLRTVISLVAMKMIWSGREREMRNEK